MSTTQKSALTFVVGFVIGVFISWGSAHAATVVTTGMEVVGSIKIDRGVVSYPLTKVLDHDNGAVCYVIGTSVSCLSNG